MKNVSREEIKTIFKKTKKLNIPKEIENVYFESLAYYSWFDVGQNYLFFISEINQEIFGTRFDVLRGSSKGLRRGFCDICLSERKMSEIGIVSASVKNKPKDVNYRSKGFHMCIDYEKCNVSLISKKIEGKVEEVILKYQ